MKDWLISVFDYTGNASRPYEEAGWDVTRIDIQNGIDFLAWDFGYEFNQRNYPEGNKAKIGIIAMVPCTHDATSGAKHFKRKDELGITIETDRLMERLYLMLAYFEFHKRLTFWQVEQPRTRLHKRFKWLGEIKQKFNPCDYAGYDPNPENSRYNKETWLFGRFNKMIPKRLEPISKENPGWKKFGGKSLRTKNERSKTPLGFSYAFHHVNN